MDGRLRGHIQVDVYPVCLWLSVGNARNHGEGTGRIGVAAVYAHVALVFAFTAESFQRHILDNLAVVMLHAGHQGVVHGAFYLVHIFCVACNLEQSLAKLHPGEGYASLHGVRCRMSLFPVPAIPAFKAASAARNVDLFPKDMAPCGQCHLQVVGISSKAVHLKQSDVARHHFVAFLPVVK